MSDMMTPKRPYIARALYEWLLDNELTPHVVIDANYPGTEVPQEFVQDGQIVLNIHPDATTGFEMGTTRLSFQARFGGVPRRVIAPYGALLAIYARENGAGSIFEPEAPYDDLEVDLVPDETPTPGLQSVDNESHGTSTSEGPDDEPPQPTPPRRKGRPQLKVIK